MIVADQGGRTPRTKVRKVCNDDMRDRTPLKDCLPSGA